MATVKRFEDLDIWKRSRALADQVFQVMNQGSFAKDYELRSQINRSSGSVMDNIAEGFDRGGRVEFIHFLSIAKGSCAEVRSQLYRAYDRRHITQEVFEALEQEAQTIVNMIGGFISYLNGSEIKGSKFKDRIA